MAAYATRRDLLLMGIVGLVLGAVLGALLVATGPAEAANGDTMFIGEKNSAPRVTRLNTKGGLRIDNFAAGNPALLLNVVGDTPPMTVNSTKKVTDLNADRLDNWHIHYIAPRVATATPPDPGQICGTADCGRDVMSTTIEAPADGMLLLGAHVDLERTTGGEDIVECGFRVDEGWISSRTTGYTTISVGGSADDDGDDCALTSYALVSAGTHTVDLRVKAVADTDTQVGWGGSLWAMWIPIDGGTGLFYSAADAAPEADPAPAP